jgi:hypothetical protein
VLDSDAVFQSAIEMEKVFLARNTLNSTERYAGATRISLGQQLRTQLWGQENLPQQFSRAR